VNQFLFIYLSANRIPFKLIHELEDKSKSCRNQTMMSKMML